MGGHALAAGLLIKRDNLNEFKKAMEKYSNSKGIKEYIPTIKIDKVLSKDDLEYETIEEIKLLEPFGEANKPPIFAYKNAKINSIRTLSEGKHLKLNLKGNNTCIDAIGFNLGNLVEEYLIGDIIDVIGTLNINEFNGYKNIQMIIQDMRKSI